MKKYKNWKKIFKTERKQHIMHLEAIASNIHQLREYVAQLHDIAVIHNDECSFAGKESLQMILFRIDRLDSAAKQTLFNTTYNQTP